MFDTVDNGSGGLHRNLATTNEGFWYVVRKGTAIGLSRLGPVLTYFHSRAYWGRQIHMSSLR